MSATSQSMAERIEQARREYQAQKDQEQSEQRALDKRSPKVFGEDRRVPVTRQAIYGDLEQEETAIREALKESAGVTDPFTTNQLEVGERILATSGKEMASKQLRAMSEQERRAKLIPEEPQATDSLSDIAAKRLAEIENEKQERYRKVTGITKEEQDRLAQLESEMRAIDTTDVTQDITTFARLDQLAAQRDDLAKQIAGKGSVTDIAGQRIYIPPPEFANSPVLVTAARTVSEMSRGMLWLAGAIAPDITGDELEQLVPQIRDEDAYVNIVSEGANLVAGGLGGFKVATYIAKKIPRLAGKLKSLLQAGGVAAGEAVVVTGETETLRTAITGEDLDTMDTKLQMVYESLGLGGLISLGSKTIKAVADLSPVAAVLQALPLAISGTRKGGERTVADMLENITYRETKGRWASPEERMEALQEVRQIMVENYSAQTGGRSLLDDIANDEVVKYGVDDAFPTTFPGLAVGTDASGRTVGVETFQEIEARIATTEAIPEYKGIRREQKEEFKKAAQEVVESTLPPSTTPRTRLDTRTEAEAVGQEARQELTEAIETGVQTQQAAKQAEFDTTIEAALKKTEEARGATSSAGSKAGAEQAQNNAVLANEAADKVAKEVQKSFLNLRKAKNELYKAYDNLANAVTINGDDLFGAMTELGAKYNLGDMRGMVLRDKPEYQKIFAAMEKAEKDGVPFTMSLLDLETLVRSIRSTKKVVRDNPTQINALTELETFYTKRINDVLSKNKDIADARAIAEGAHIKFREAYINATGDKIADALQFGDKADAIDLAVVADQVRGKLKSSASATSATGSADRQYLQGVLNILDDEAKAAFTKNSSDFYKYSILSNVNVDLTSKAAIANPVATITSLNKQITRVKNSPAYAYAPDSVKREIDTLFERTKEVGDNVVEANSLIKDLQRDQLAIERRAKASSTYQFAASFENEEAIAAVKAVLGSESDTLKLKKIWESAGKVGKAGADGLTDTQRKLKATLAQGIMDSVWTAGARGSGKTKLSPAQIEDLVNNNPMFRVIFPKDSDTGKVFDHVLSMNSVLSAKASASRAAEQSLKGIDNATEFVQQFITYVRGPLSKEGRQSKLLARLFFKMAGGQKQAEQILIDTFVDPGLAFRLLKEAEERIAQGLMRREEALNFGIRKHILARLGFNTEEEFDKVVQDEIIRAETEEGLSPEPSQ